MVFDPAGNAAVTETGNAMDVDKMLAWTVVLTPTAPIYAVPAAFCTWTVDVIPTFPMVADPAGNAAVIVTGKAIAVASIVTPVNPEPAPVQFEQAIVP